MAERWPAATWTTPPGSLGPQTRPTGKAGKAGAANSKQQAPKHVLLVKKNAPTVKGGVKKVQLQQNSRPARASPAQPAKGGAPLHRQAGPNRKVSVTIQNKGKRGPLNMRRDDEGDVPMLGGRAPLVAGTRPYTTGPLAFSSPDPRAAQPAFQQSLVGSRGLRRNAHGILVPV